MGDDATGFEAWWAEYLRRNGWSFAPGADKARAAWLAATERAATAAELEDKAEPSEARGDTHVCGWNDACHHVARTIRGGA